MDFSPDCVTTDDTSAQAMLSVDTATFTKPSSCTNRYKSSPNYAPQEPSSPSSDCSDSSDDGYSLTTVVVLSVFMCIFFMSTVFLSYKLNYSQSGKFLVVLISMSCDYSLSLPWCFYGGTYLSFLIFLL